jgi:error-prone DNA polymerase
MDVKHHLMAFERKQVTSKGGITADQAGRLPNGTKAFVVGNPIRLRFPPTASGKRVMFFDLEDESGLLNVTCFDDVYQRYGGVVICSPYITLRGVAQVRDGHNAFLAQQAFSYKPQLRGAERASEPLPVVVGDYLHG